MNRRDYEAHAAWAESVREDRMRAMHANRHAVKPANIRPRRQPAKWRGLVAALLAVIR